MEDVRDRVDDLMRGSAYAAEPLENICARCRVSLAKTAPSLQSNLHAIEASRIEAEEYAEEPSAEVEQTLISETEAEPIVADSEYVSGEGYKTEAELQQESRDAYQMLRSFEPQKNWGAVLDWLVITKIGKKILGGGFVLLVILFNAFDGDEDSAPPVGSEVPYEASELPPVTESDGADAPLPLPTSPEQQPIAPATNPGSWVTTNDYPSRALREEREGTTAFRLDVGIDGKVTACTVTASSGHGDLDAATCKALMRRARFEPITDGGGPASWTSRVRWTIPK